MMVISGKYTENATTKKEKDQQTQNSTQNTS